MVAVSRCKTLLVFRLFFLDVKIVDAFLLINWKQSTRTVFRQHTVQTSEEFLAYWGILWNDPDLDIDWPIESPIISDRDAQLPRLRDVSRLDLMPGTMNSASLISNPE